MSIQRRRQSSQGIKSIEHKSGIPKEVLIDVAAVGFQRPITLLESQMSELPEGILEITIRVQHSEVLGGAQHRYCH